jgi:hypothetical protein
VCDYFRYSTYINKDPEGPPGAVVSWYRLGVPPIDILDFYGGTEEIGTMGREIESRQGIGW